MIEQKPEWPMGIPYCNCGEKPTAHECPKDVASLRQMLDKATADLALMTKHADEGWKLAADLRGALRDEKAVSEARKTMADNHAADAEIWRHKYEDMNREANIWHDKRKESEADAKILKAAMEDLARQKESADLQVDACRKALVALFAAFTEVCRTSTGEFNKFQVDALALAKPFLDCPKHGYYAKYQTEAPCSCPTTQANETPKTGQGKDTENRKPEIGTLGGWDEEERRNDKAQGLENRSCACPERTANGETGVFHTCAEKRKCGCRHDPYDDCACDCHFSGGPR